MTDDYMKQAEDLTTKLRRLEAEFNEAEWTQEVERITALDYEIRMIKHKLAIGETHDLPF